MGTVRLGLSTERLRADASRDSFPAAWILVAAILCAAAAGGIGFAVARMAGNPAGERDRDTMAGLRPGLPGAASEGEGAIPERRETRSRFFTLP